MAAALQRSYFGMTRPYPARDSRGCFYYICRKQKKESGADLLDSEDVGLLSHHTVRHNGWAERDDWCQLLITRLLSLGSCDARPKVARVVF